MPKLKRKSASTLRNEDKRRKELCSADSTQKLECERMLETMYGRCLQLPVNYMIPKKIPKNDLQSTVDDFHASTKVLQKEKQHKQTQRQSLKANNIEELIRNFHKIVSEEPLYICTCCKQLLYKKAVKETSKAKIKKGDNSAGLAEIIDKCVTGTKGVEEKEWICKICHSHLKKSKMPPCASANGMEFPPQGLLRNLNPLEFTFLSPLLPFMKIHKAPVGKQLKIHCNMVVVPSDTVNTVQSLPRLSNNTSTIKAQLKRRLRNNILCTIQIFDPKSEDEWEVEKNDENVAGSTNTLITTPDFFKTNERDLVDSFAPAENYQAISMFTEKTAEEQAYTGTFCGQARIPNDKRTVPVSYGEIVKSELRNMDRRCARNVENIFFLNQKTPNEVPH
ncbi:unnamed protein product [Mytilus coruscus]|uniref:DUF6570 domain-containing protein n=1 Tax=Mytilus coruscus TaxID=42192 RepID=A0A6J8ATT9_MYTCO|nr:unnamed protein product [Mytilus coruscus]